VNRLPRHHPTLLEAIVGVLCGFLLGVVITAGVAWKLTHTIPRVTTEPSEPEISLVSPPEAPAKTREPVADPGSVTSPVIAPVAPDPPTPAMASAVAELRDRSLDLPVQGASRGELRDSFDERRDGTRAHEAIDMLAPRNTPILAVEDGRIVRLFSSKAGGTTIYQFDPTARFVYYYAHLEKYANGLAEGNQVQRGQVIGYVGTSGNAPKNTPHLHFAIFQLTEKKEWWKGTPLDPYLILK
jgi:murein DD-endopeptidase MepM/ murein hydrolase activator NlpD